MEQKLTDSDYNTLGRLLFEALEKDYPHYEGLQSASVLIFNLFKANYAFDETNLDIVIKNSGQKYTPATKKFLKRVIFVCKYLVRGLDKKKNKRFRLNRRPIVNPAKKQYLQELRKKRRSLKK